MKDTTSPARTSTRYQPKIVEESKEKIQDFINYFIEVENTPDDEDFTQAFPWRSFRASIESLQTPDAASWIIETIPLWPNGVDQESLVLMAKKTAQLMDSNSITELLGILEDQTIPMENKRWVIFILENIEDQSLLGEAKKKFSSLKTSSLTPEFLSEIQGSLDR